MSYLQLADHSLQPIMTPLPNVALYIGLYISHKGHLLSTDIVASLNVVWLSTVGGK